MTALVMRTRELINDISPAIAPGPSSMRAERLDEVVTLSNREVGRLTNDTEKWLSVFAEAGITAGENTTLKCRPVSLAASFLCWFKQNVFHL